MPRKNELPEVLIELDQLLTETELAKEARHEWMKRGNCYQRGPGPWHPGLDENGKVRDKALMDLAMRYCETCPVRIACLTHAVLAKEPDGIWGKRLPRYRRRLRHLARIRRPDLIYPNCGTVDKYHQHIRKFEKPCQPCIDAWSEHQQRPHSP